MDVYKAIRALHDERKRLDKLIQSLERLQVRGDGVQPRRRTRRRGRRSMSAEERKQVSDRMKKYWADRRQTTGESIAEPEYPDRCDSLNADR